MKKKIFIIGSGPGDIMHLTHKAKEAMAACEEVYSFERLGELFRSVRHDIEKCTYEELFIKVGNSCAQTIAIMVSGDVGFFSIAKTILEKFGHEHEIHTLCGISSLQYFCARVGISYENIDVMSLHGRKQSILGHIAYHRHTFVLTGGENNAKKILKSLQKEIPSGIKVMAGEMLSMANERIMVGTVAELSECEFDSLTVLLFENTNHRRKETVLFDQDFIRNKTPMTKQEVRWVSVNMLNIKPSNIVFDIGAGSGSVAIEMSRKAHDGIVYAIEKNAEAYALLNENRLALGALNLIPVFGEATEEIIKLPVPDKVFIGGSGGALREIVQYFFEKNPGVSIVINAITLESLGLAMNVLKDLGITPSVSCLNCSRNKVMDDYNLMMANNPVYIICGNKTNIPSSTDGLTGN